MPRLRITTSEQNLLATAHATAGPPSDVAEVRAALAAAKVVHGLDDAAIVDLGQALGDGSYTGQRVVARGRPPTHGEDGRVDGLFPPGPVAGEARADGSIDFRERHFLAPVSAGTVLGCIVAPTPGSAGIDVLGRQVPPKPGKPHNVKAGPGTRRDGDRLIAARSGVLLRTARELDVVPLYTHGADVDYASGSLHTDGSLEVRGDVQQGFAATATGDVRVTGSVLDGAVRSDGSVLVDQGILGAGAVVHAGHDLTCRHATAATLAAGGDVHLLDQAAHCRIRGRALLADSGRGTVLGGEVRVQHSITLRTAGTAVGAATHLLVGDVTTAAAEAVRATNLDSKVSERARQRRASDGATVTKAARTSLRTADAELEERLRLRLRQRELLQDACVTVLDTVHAGTRITFGEKTWTTETSRHQLRLCWSSQDESIREEPLP